MITRVKGISERPPEIEKSRVGALSPGVVPMTRHCNAQWHGPQPGWELHGLNARRHVFGLALATSVEDRRLEIWAYIHASSVEHNEFFDGCWRVGAYTPEMWADLTARRRIP